MPSARTTCSHRPSRVSHFHSRQRCDLVTGTTLEVLTAMVRHRGWHGRRSIGEEALLKKLSTKQAKIDNLENTLAVAQVEFSVTFQENVALKAGVKFFRMKVVYLDEKNSE